MRVKFDVDTKLIFQIGYPMDQGCAAFLHNAMYEYANVNAVCMTAEITKGGLPAFLEAVKTLNADGFDITTPHKTDIIPYLDECDTASRMFKCVNHVKLRDGKLIGTGLDGVGMGMAIEHEIGSGIKGRRLLVIGAGAVAGLIATDLCGRGVSEVMIVNRTIEKAKYIADNLQTSYKVPCRYAELTNEVLNAFAPEADLVVQCTSLGKGKWKDFASRLSKSCVTADVLYPDTDFLRAAREQGLCAIDGRGMLFFQQLAMMEFRFGVKMQADALAEAEEAVEIAVAMRRLRNIRKGIQ